MVLGIPSIANWMLLVAQSGTHSPIPHHAYWLMDLVWCCLWHLALLHESKLSMSLETCILDACMASSEVCMQAAATATATAKAAAAAAAAAAVIRNWIFWSQISGVKLRCSQGKENELQFCCMACSPELLWTWILVGLVCMLKVTQKDKWECLIIKALQTLDRLFSEMTVLQACRRQGPTPSRPHAYLPAAGALLAHSAVVTIHVAFSPEAHYNCQGLHAPEEHHCGS
jgi:hypothetical protein